MPPCSVAVVEAGIARVVVGAIDPNLATHGKGVARMRAAGVEVDVAEDPASLALIERFAFTVRSALPFVTLKMAMSLDGFVSPRPGVYRVTGDAARERVFDLRSQYDATMVGAGTVRVDDPLLTIRPHRSRRKPYTRVIVCETTPISADSRVLAPPAGAPPDAYRPTIVLAPAGRAEEFEPLRECCDLLLVGTSATRMLDLTAAMTALRTRGIATVLCEGGPTLAGRLLEHRLIERVVWFVAPAFLGGPGAVPAIVGADLVAFANGWTFEGVERVGDDLMISARLPHV